MRAIEHMEYGKVSTFYMERKGADANTVEAGPYYRRQVWRDGKNVTEYVPAEQAPIIREAIAGCERFEQLVQEFVETTMVNTRAQRDQMSKNNSRKRKRSGMRKSRLSSI